MNKLKTNLILGFLFVSILGTFAHFVYDWSGENPFAGFITPVNESTWEHMKLLFFPALLYIPIASYYLKDKYPYIAQAFAWGIVLGTLLIPVFFYSYSGILGYTIMSFDIGSFFLSTFFCFYITYRLAKRNIPLGNFVFVPLTLLAFFFVVFTYAPPGWAIFQEPS